MCRPAAAVHGNLSALAHSVTAPSNVLWLPLPFSRFLFSPVPKTKCSSQLSVLVGKIKFIAQGEFNPSLPRSSTLDLPPALSSNPASGRRGSLYATLDSAAVWLVVAPALAHTHLDCALLHCRCCLRKTRESQVFVPGVPRTAQLYYHAEALRPHVVADSESLRGF